MWHDDVDGYGILLVISQTLIVGQYVHTCIHTLIQTIQMHDTLREKTTRRT